MAHSPALLVLGLALIAGCAETRTCPTYAPMRNGGQCVAQDAGSWDAQVDGSQCPSTCPAERPHCEARDGGPAECVACRASQGNEDCPDPALSKCVEGQCVLCESDGDCAHLGTEDGLRCGGLRCGACASRTEMSDCSDGYACNESTGRCSTNRLELCDTCTADWDCAQGYRCFADRFGPDIDVGAFCFVVTGGADACDPPYHLTEGRSVSGRESTYCEPPLLATCASLEARGNSCTRTNPDVAGPQADDECGHRIARDGYCLPNETCTYACTNTLDCRRGLACSNEFCVQPK